MNLASAADNGKHPLSGSDRPAESLRLVTNRFITIGSKLQLEICFLDQNMTKLIYPTYSMQGWIAPRPPSLFIYCEFAQFGTFLQVQSGYDLVLWHCAVLILVLIP